MAVVTPTISNGCKGTFSNGDPNTQLKCVTSFDDDGDPVYECVTWRFFYVSCPKVNRSCNSRSGAWVAATTCCSLGL